MRKVNNRKSDPRRIGPSEKPKTKEIYLKYKNTPALKGVTFEEFEFQMGNGPVVDTFESEPIYLYQFIPEAVTMKIASDSALIEANKKVEPIEDPNWICKNLISKAGKKVRCPSHSYYAASAQTRGGDEGMTHFATCAKCGQRQKS